MRYIYIILTIVFNLLSVYISTLLNTGVVFESAFLLILCSGIIISILSKKGSKKLKDIGLGLLLGSGVSVVVLLLTFLFMFNGKVC